MSEKSKKILSSIFVAVCGALTVLNAVIDFCFDGDSTVFKYCGIILCVVFAASACIKDGKSSIIVLCGLIFTCAADYFLLVKNDRYEIGVAAFIVAQIFYFIKIKVDKNGAKKGVFISLAVRVAVSCALIIVAAVTGIGEPLVYLVAVYAVNFAANIIEAYSAFSVGVKNRVFAIGLSLFALCDICVLLFNLGAFIHVGYDEQTAIFFVKLSWVFYLPSQCLISLSSRLKNR